MPHSRSVCLRMAAPAACFWRACKTSAHKQGAKPTTYVINLRLYADLWLCKGYSKICTGGGASHKSGSATAQLTGVPVEGLTKTRMSHHLQEQVPCRGPWPVRRCKHATLPGFASRGLPPPCGCRSVWHLAQPDRPWPDLPCP